MNTDIPRPDWLSDRRFHWPCYKFGMSLDELFTTLHNQFNTWPAPLQDWEAFHHDVWEISEAATTKEELMSGIESRMKTRCAEMTRVWDLITVHLAAGRSILPEAHWRHACQFFRTKSMDSMIAFLFEFLHPDEKEKVTRIRNQLFPDSAQRAPAGLKSQAESSSPGDQSLSDDSGLSLYSQHDVELVQPVGVIPTTSPGDQSLSDDSGLSLYSQHDEELVQPVSVIPTPYSQPRTEDPASSGLSTRLNTPEPRQRTKSNSRSPLASADADADANANARKDKSGHQQPRSRISKKRASPIQSSQRIARQRVTEEPAAPCRYNLRPRAPRKAK
ncbi:hypothetical protein F5B18DRAFT_649586 [Nemania serpens]|nr:hypothetical protein F5B18DRAFT_649586 [Nemania serpens]